MKLFILILFGSLVLAQPSKETIKNSNSYYYGEALAETEQEASSFALSELTKSISIQIENIYSNNVVETASDLNRTVNSILKTYSTATLRNVKTIITPRKGKFEVFHYIEKTEVEKIFDERKTLIKDIFQKAEIYQKNYYLGDALKLYYYAIILINSLPESNLIFNEINLVPEIPARISEIINNVKFTLKNNRKLSDMERELVFSISYKDKPVSKIELSCWSGAEWMNISAADGEGIVHWYGSSIDMDKLNINIKYQYFENRSEIKAVADLWELVKKPSFALNKEILIKENNIDTKHKIDSNIPEQKNKMGIISNQNDLKIEEKLNVMNCSEIKDSLKIIKKIKKSVTDFGDIFKNCDLKKVKKLYGTDEFLKNKISNIITYNKPALVGETIEGNINKTITGWEFRKIKILNKYPTIKKQSSEYIVLDFDKQGNLEDINYGVMDNIYQKVETVAKEYGKDWEHRQTMIKFIEKYRTAFLGRDISTIDSLFADEAVIIVGRIMKKNSLKDNYNYLKLNESQPDVKYIQLTKNEYLRNLKNLFKQTEDIFIGYSSLDISRKNNEKVYGISLRQHYHSSNYADEGYLFLLVDFESINPQIYVRAWQPEEWDDKSLIKLSNFKINR